MTLPALITLVVVASAFLLLAFSKYRAEWILLGALSCLLVFGLIEPSDALVGLSNEGMVAVGLLFVVSAGLKDTGGVARMIEKILGSPKTIRAALIRIMTPAALLSTVLNNTPVVAVLLPVVGDWAKRRQVAPSKLLLPLSYAAILGGTCTLIGTSTNLVVNGLLVAEGLPSLGLFEIGKIGLPCTLLGLLYLWLFADRLLPDRRSAIEQVEGTREYSVEMIVEEGSSLVGRSIEEAGLRHLPNVYLMEIERDGELLVAVSGRERLRALDRLVFVGVVDSVVELQKIRGLTPATDSVFELDTPREERTLVEAVVSSACPLIGTTIREGQFRTVYQAAIIAVARDGERIHRKIGDISLRPGDTLLLETHPSFLTRHRHSRDFFLVSGVDTWTAPRHHRAGIAVAILLLMMASVATGLLPLVTAALLAAGAMLMTRCTSLMAARRAVDWQVLMIITAALGLGRALQVTGAADAIAQGLLAVAGESPVQALAAVYLLTMIFTETMSNAAAAVIMYPVAHGAALALGADPIPFAIAIMIAASASFLTPIGYQTNLMVYGPGGYRFSDYLRLGIVPSLAMWALTTALVPWFWPF